MHLIHTLNHYNHDLIAQLPNAASFVFCLWIIHAINLFSQGLLVVCGIRPRSLWGLAGIPLAPWVHGSFDHLFFNSIPLLILSDLLFAQGFITMVSVSLGVVCLGGLGTWLIGRPALHIGASGLIMGYMGYLLTEAYLGTAPNAWISGGVVFYYFGSSLLSLLPSEKHISFEGHLCGFLSGVALAVYPTTLFDASAQTVAPYVYELFQTIQSIF